MHNDRLKMIAGINSTLKGKTVGDLSAGEKLDS
jgi:hypothetical protein